MITVRKAVRADSETIAGFQISMAYETEKLVLDKKIVAAGVAAVFERPELGAYYVAVENGEIVGSLLTTFEWSDWRNGMVLWIQSVYVEPGKRRRGIYTRLYSFLQKLVQESVDLRGIRLYADIANTGAHDTYVKLGMNADLTVVR
jgi:GNAT superfamily N-acetyltransferase